MHQSLRIWFRHLLRPARGGAAGVVVVFACLGTLGLKAGLIGIPLDLILTSWFFKYAYILFDHTTRGFDEPPTLDIQMLNPLDEQRPLGQVAILSLIWFAAKLAATYLGGLASFLVVCLGGFCLPASVCVLGLEGNVFKAANPLEWIRVIHGLGWWYLLVLALIVTLLAASGSLIRFNLWTPVLLGFNMFAILCVFNFLGGALYERRYELGLETYVSPERSADQERLKALKASEQAVTEAYGQMRVGAHVKCWAMLQAWLDAQGKHPEDYRWLCERVVSWSDGRYISRLTENYLDRLLELKRTGEALDLVADRLKVDKGFRPKSAAATLSIAQMAARGGGAPWLARVLLEDFGSRFAGDPRVSIAQALAQDIGADRRGTKALGVKAP